ncbi:hypothetical protein BF49_3795 [Bradyrhizobium sp.]|nr:hypothetical protein BF49_3795 [Bradyrhizobium sp.]
MRPQSCADRDNHRESRCRCRPSVGEKTPDHGVPQSATGLPEHAIPFEF